MFAEAISEIDFCAPIISIFAVKNTCSISDFGRNPAAVVRRAQESGSITVCRNGRVVGFLLSRDRMEAILETLELMADAEALKAIRNYEGGKARLKDVSCLDDH